jgi:hypothetical protein
MPTDYGIMQRMKRYRTDSRHEARVSAHSILELFPKNADDNNGMIQSELMNLLVQVVKSWQVITATIVVLLYIFLINYVANPRRRPRSVSTSKPLASKGQSARKTAKAIQNETPEVEDNADSNEALGLEEEE